MGKGGNSRRSNAARRRAAEGREDKKTDAAEGQCRENKATVEAAMDSHK